MAKYAKALEQVFPEDEIEIDPGQAIVQFDTEQFGNVWIMVGIDGIVLWDDRGTDFGKLVADAQTENLVQTLQNIRTELEQEDDGYEEVAEEVESADFWEAMRKKAKRKSLHIVTYGDKFYKNPPQGIKRTFNAKCIGSKKPPNLKQKRGTDEEIQRVVRSAPKFEQFISSIIDVVEREQLDVFGIYCASGHHRSVACAELLLMHVYKDAKVTHLTIKR